MTEYEGKLKGYGLGNIFSSDKVGDLVKGFRAADRRRQYEEAQRSLFRPVQEQGDLIQEQKEK